MVVVKAVKKNDHRCVLFVRTGGGEMGAVPDKRAWSPILAAPLKTHTLITENSVTPYYTHLHAHESLNSSK